MLDTRGGGDGTVPRRRIKCRTVLPMTGMASRRDNLPPNSPPNIMPILVFLAHPGAVELAKNGSERPLRPSVIQRKMTNGDHAMWVAEGAADIRTVVDTERLTGASPFGTILKTVGA